MAGAAAVSNPPWPTRPFLDTNVLLYLISDDAHKASCTETLLREGATINVQVLNEFTNVARRKLAMTWEEIDDALQLICKRCDVHDLTQAVHNRARALAQQHQFSWFDALIVAAALDAGSRTLYSEDMQNGMRVASSLTIRNPFAVN